MWCVFFFVKQKTAYEMRISDWSSDVCSSDLKQAELGSSAFRRLCRAEFLNYVRVREWVDVHRQLRSVLNGPRDGSDGAGDPDAIHRAILEIGTASCRDRVCQYV